MLNRELFSASHKQKHKIKAWGVAFVFVALAATLGAMNASAQAALSEPVLFTPLPGQEFASPAPVISGKSMAGDAVLVFIDGIFNGQAAVGNSVFEYRPFLPLSSGDHTIRLKAKDTASGALSEFSEPRTVRIIPNPAPTVLAPRDGAALGQDRIWVGGVAKNGSLVRILVDGAEAVRAMVKNNPS